MLVLSRKLNEQIRIDDQITISILSVKGSVVRIGIEAPPQVRIVRAELPPLDKHQAGVEPQSEPAEAPRESRPNPGRVESKEVSSFRRPGTQLAITRPGSLRSHLARRLLAGACHA